MSISETKHDKATCPACGKNTIQSLVLPDLRMKFGQQRNDTLPMFKIGILPRQQAPPARNNDLSVPV